MKFCKSLYLLTLFIFIIFSGQLASANVVAHEVRLYHDDSFKTEQDVFFPFDTIYTVIDLKNLNPGDYEVSIDWVQPDGTLARTTTYPFTLDKAEPNYRVYFWLKVHEKGPLKQLISGAEYPDSVFGEWEVHISCNGDKLSTRSFQISDENQQL